MSFCAIVLNKYFHILEIYDVHILVLVVFHFFFSEKMENTIIYEEDLYREYGLTQKYACL